MAPNTRVAEPTMLPAEDSGKGYKKIKPTMEETEVLKKKVLDIRRAIRDEERQAVKAHPWLGSAYNDIIGSAIFVGSAAVCIGTGYCYWNGYISALPTILLIGFFVGLLHELEHDLIHDMYFKNYVWIQDMMFMGIWLSKIHVNPWYRRVIHMKHHARSGQHDDIEERLIGLGLPFSWLRIACAVNPFASLLLSRQIKKESPEFSPVELLLCSAPVASILFFLTAVLYLQLTGLFPLLVTADPAWNEFFWKINMIINIPNIVRQCSLVLMSSYCHYYEDLPEGADGVFYQNQILDNKWLWPFQLFCFNFGSTHIIHHYVTNQTFYLRQWIAPGCHAAMIKNGVRHNDLSIVPRANRFSEDYPSQGFFKGMKKVWKA